MSHDASPYDPAIAEIEAQISALQVTLETLKGLRAAQGAGTATGSAVSTARLGVAVDLPHDIFFQMTVPDAAEKYLKLMKATKPVAALAEALLKGGLKSSSKDFTAMLRPILSRDARFVSINGEWGLAEWYKRSRAGADAQTETKRGEATRKEGPRKKNSKGEHFSGESLKGRTLTLLDSNAKDTFDAQKIAERLNAQVPSVSAALASLFADRLILRPERSRYKSKHPA